MPFKTDAAKVKPWHEERHWSQEHLAALAGIGLRTVQSEAADLVGCGHSQPRTDRPDRRAGAALQGNVRRGRLGPRLDMAPNSIFAPWADGVYDPAGDAPRGS